MEKSQLENNGLYKRKFYALSISYGKADTRVRGKFAFFSEQFELISKKIQNFSQTSALILSTCNRTEFYLYTNKDIHNLYCEFACTLNILPEELLQYSVCFEEEQAIKHFLRVAAGLESQIIGDFEIISQIKTSFYKCKAQKITDAFIERLVNTGIQASKKIKATTALSNGATSMAYAPVHYLLKNVSNLETKKIVLVGMGKMGANLCANLIKHLKKPNITLFNRTFEKAYKIADKWGLKAKKYSELNQEINAADIILIATGAAIPIIKDGDINSFSPKLILDISIPNNVEKSLKNYPGLTLLDVDDLSRIINKTLENRSKEIPLAEAIVEELYDEFYEWKKNRKFAPIILAFKNELNRLKEIQSKSLKKGKSQKEISTLGISDGLVQKITNRLADYLINNSDKADHAIGLFKEMFQLQLTQFKKNEENDPHRDAQ